MSTRDRLTRLEHDTKSLSRGLETARKLPTVQIEQFDDEYWWRVWHPDRSLFDEGYKTTYEKARKAALDSALGTLLEVPTAEPPTKVGKAPELDLRDYWKMAGTWW